VSRGQAVAPGGNYMKLMQRNLRAIGEDLAGVLKSF
jgi:hypothetical protein